MSQINVNTITGKDGGSAVNFPHGITVTGVVTATTLNQNVVGVVTATSFSGDGSALTGIDSSAIKDGSNVKVQAISTGANVTGNLGVSGNATVTGNLTVNGTTTTIDTAVTSVDSLSVDGEVIVGAGLSVAGTTKFSGPLTEKSYIDTSGALPLHYFHDLNTHGNVHWNDTAPTAAFTYNLRGDGVGSPQSSVNQIMKIGESMSFWFAHACASNTAYYMTDFRIDGTYIQGANIVWAGGSAPTAAGGGTGTKDVYTFTIFKTADATFKVFASVTNHG